MVNLLSPSGPFLRGIKTPDCSPLHHRDENGSDVFEGIWSNEVLVISGIFTVHDFATLLKPNVLLSNLLKLIVSYVSMQ